MTARKIDVYFITCDGCGHNEVAYNKPTNTPILWKTYTKVHPEGHEVVTHWCRKCQRLVNFEQEF